MSQQRRTPVRQNTREILDEHAGRVALFHLSRGTSDLRTDYLVIVPRPLIFRVRLSDSPIQEETEDPDEETLQLHHTPEVVVIDATDHTPSKTVQGFVVDTVGGRRLVITHNNAITMSINIDVTRDV
jgi:hypothetical protein